MLNITNNTKLDEKIEGDENFRAWKYRIMLILQENDLDKFVKEEAKDREEEEAKSKHKKDIIIAKRIIADSTKDNLIPQVSSREIPKEMFDALSSLLAGRNINRKMTLRNHLKSVKTQKLETMQSYFSRVSQIRD